MGKALGTFWLVWERKACKLQHAGGQEDSTALQALRMTRVCLQVLNVHYGMVCCVAAEVAVDTWCVEVI